MRSLLSHIANFRKLAQQSNIKISDTIHTAIVDIQELLNEEPWGSEIAVSLQNEMATWKNVSPTKDMKGEEEYTYEVYYVSSNCIQNILKIITSIKGQLSNQDNYMANEENSKLLADKCNYVHNALSQLLTSGALNRNTHSKYTFRPDVLEAQKRINKEYNYTIKEDGLLGPETTEALKRIFPTRETEGAIADILNVRSLGF